MLVFLIGMMGSGKTSVGNLLAKKLQVPLIDTDKEIEKNENQLVKEIFDQKGEKYFRKIESKIFLKKRRSAVVSCGGGIILYKKNREFLKNEGYTLHLKTSVSVIEKRLVGIKDRPLINYNNPYESLTNIYQKRKHLYDEASNSFILTDKMSIKQVYEATLEKLKFEKIYC